MSIPTKVLSADHKGRKKEMKTIKISGAIAFLATLLLAPALSHQQYPEPFTQTRESNSRMTPDTTLAALKAGNERFLRGTLIGRGIRQQFRDTAKGQYPFAVVLNCQDSRAPVELLFDLNNGDAFSLRIAGNVLNEDMLGGLEFGTAPYYAKLIVVMGHTGCGAITGTIDMKADIDRGERGNLIDLLRKIRPALDMVDPSIQPRTSSNPKYVNAIARANVLLVMRQIRERSGDLKRKFDSKAIDMIGAMHDLSTGEVTFFKE